MPDERIEDLSDIPDSELEKMRLFREIGPIDFFIHDSHHSYDHMTAEYELALQHLRPGGVIASHDVLYCNAWEHFVRKHRISRVQTVRNFGLCVVDRPIRDR